MPLHNADFVAVFNEIAGLLEILNDNPFRVRAYRQADAQYFGAWPGPHSDDCAR